MTTVTWSRMWCRLLLDRRCVPHNTNSVAFLSVCQKTLRVCTCWCVSCFKIVSLDKFSIFKILKPVLKLWYPENLQCSNIWKRATYLDNVLYFWIENLFVVNIESFYKVENDNCLLDIWEHRVIKCTVNQLSLVSWTVLNHKCNRRVNGRWNAHACQEVTFLRNE